MTTKLDIVKSALGEIGLATYVFDATPEELQDLMNRLNRIAAMWDGLGIRTGYNFGADINAESGLPDTVVLSFEMNLAVSIAPTFGKVLSAETKRAAKLAYNAMLTTLSSIPRVPRNPRMPIGTGAKLDVMERTRMKPVSGDLVVREGLAETRTAARASTAAKSPA